MENFQKIAVLIDADNTQLTKLEAVLHEVSTYGRIVVKKSLWQLAQGLAEKLGTGAQAPRHPRRAAV